MTLAFVFVNCISDEQAAEVEKALKDVQGVLEANLTTGIYDLLLKVQADGEQQLEEVIKKIKAISGVTSTMTSIIYKAVSFAPSSTPNDKPEKV